jgi:hypothetical protein
MDYLLPQSITEAQRSQRCRQWGQRGTTHTPGVGAGRVSVDRHIGRFSVEVLGGGPTPGGRVAVDPPLRRKRVRSRYGVITLRETPHLVERVSSREPV